MGEMADFELDIAFEQLEHHTRYSDAPITVQHEEGLVDENGLDIGRSNSLPFAPAHKEK